MLKNQKGFTLVELIVVIVIIGILAAIAVPKFQDLSNSAKAAACKQNQAAIESAAAIFYANQAIAGTARYPDTIQELVNAGMIDDNALQCPGNGTYTFSGGVNGTGKVTCTVGTHVR